MMILVSYMLSMRASSWRYLVGVRSMEKLKSEIQVVVISVWMVLAIEIDGIGSLKVDSLL